MRLDTDPFFCHIPAVRRGLCNRCDIEGRCVNGKTYAWSTKGVKVGECKCSCHVFKRDDSDENSHT